MTTIRSAVAPAVVAGATGLLSAASIGLAWLNGKGPRGFIAGNQANTWLAGLAFGLIAALVLRQQPTNRLGPVLSVIGLAAATSATAVQYATYTLRTRPGALPLPDLAAWAGTVLWLPAFLLIGFAVPLLFPNGRLASRGWRWPAAVAFTGASVAIVSLATTQSIVDDGFPEATNPFDLPLADGPQVAVGLIGFVIAIAIGIGATVAIAIRMRRVSEPERRQHAWYVASVVLGVTVSLFSLPNVLTFATTALSFAALGVGIVRYRLFNIELVLSRAVVYALFTAAVLAAYVGAAAALGAQLTVGVGPALIAAVVALLLAGARQRLQRAVDHLLYGERGDPLGALTSLGEQLGGALNADSVLSTVVETVRRTLRLPYAAVRWAGESEPAYADGERSASSVEFVLAHAGDEVGHLIVGLRRGETSLSAADARLLGAFARQAGVAAHGVRATQDLRRSRERLVIAREEERRRLRRDLHDGLGPALAGITLGLETAAKAAARGDPSAESLLGTLRQETAVCVEEVRRIVADLRPPALEGVGLATALRLHADRLSRATIQVTVEVADDAAETSLPAAVEVAAYRIALEAMTNAVHHSGGRSCMVTIVHRDGLRLSVMDDGCGVAGPQPGVGLASMRDRAEELGGTCTVTFREGRGTSVEAVLPMTAR